MPEALSPERSYSFTIQDQAQFPPQAGRASSVQQKQDGLYGYLGVQLLDQPQIGVLGQDSLTDYRTVCTSSWTPSCC